MILIGRAKCVLTDVEKRSLCVHPFLLRTVALLTTATCCGGEASPTADALKRELHAVVAGQLEAFRKNDFAVAYTYAATGIRAQFPAETFEKMVRTNYGTISGNQEAICGATVDDGEHAVVHVRVRGADDLWVTYQYLLQREDQVWRIGGVVPVQAARAPSAPL